MKKLVVSLSAVCMLLACNNKKQEDSNTNPVNETTTIPANDDKASKTGSFTIDGKTYTGDITTQYFGDKTTGQYSVLCQQDDPLALLQAVFSNEKDALSGTPFKPAESFYSLEPGEVHIALSGKAIGDMEFVTSSTSAGSITVSAKTLVIKGLQVYNGDHQEKIVNATISF
ncbi:MAG: hypothetical protein ABIT05_00155 [Chitinophagaceae bacterium]